MDVFIQQAFTYSKKSTATIKTYQSWIQKLCLFAETPHPLDVQLDDITRFYVFLSDVKRYSRPSLDIVRSAIKYFYEVLCHSEAPESFRPPQSLVEGIHATFRGRRSYKHGLPDVAKEGQMERFLTALPKTNAGYIITRAYDGRPLSRVLSEIAPLTVSPSYLRHVVARTARAVGIPHGFGLRGVRASGLVHRLRRRKNDAELVEIFQDSELS